MQGTTPIEKMSPASVSYGELAEDTRHHWRKPKNSKPRRKRNHAQARKLKESSYVWSQ